MCRIRTAASSSRSLLHVASVSFSPLDILQIAQAAALEPSLTQYSCYWVNINTALLLNLIKNSSFLLSLPHLTFFNKGFTDTLVDFLPQFGCRDSDQDWYSGAQHGPFSMPDPPVHHLGVLVATRGPTLLLASPLAKRCDSFVCFCLTT